MSKLSDTIDKIPGYYQAGVILVGLVVFVLTYHDQFITNVEAMEQQKLARDEVRLLRVDGYETEKRGLIKEKKEAIKNNDAAEAEAIEQDIQTLRDKIKNLCGKLDCK